MSTFRIREAAQKDIPDMAKVRVDTWRVAYKGILPDDFLENLSYQSVSESWNKIFWEDRNPGVALFVAENQQHEIVGIAVCGPVQDHDTHYQSEIYVLYVLPQHQNQGIGRKLVTACAQHLVHDLHVKSLLIWVLAANPYRKFYESLGGKPVREKTQEIGWKLLSEVGYGWDDINILL